MLAMTLQTLLRRTLFAFATLTAIAALQPVNAASITLGGNSLGENCTYNALSVDPAGNVTVNCAAAATGGGIGAGGGNSGGGGGTTTPTACATGVNPVVTVTGPGTLAVGSSTNVTFNATCIFATRVNVTVDVTGAGCSVNGYVTPVLGTGASIQVGTSSATLGPISGSAGSTCTVTMRDVRSAGASLAPAAIGSPGMVAIAVTQGSSGNNGNNGSSGSGGGSIPANLVPSGCPTPGSGAQIAATPAGPGAHLVNLNGSWVQGSGSVTAIALPTLTTGFASGSFEVTYSALSPSVLQSVEIAISKCPGSIDPTGVSTLGSTGHCYYASPNDADVLLQWFSGNSAIYGTLSQIAGSNRFCVADPAQGTWYANIRYNYSSCNYGAAGCGEQIQWNNSTP